MMMCKNSQFHIMKLQTIPESSAYGVFGFTCIHYGVFVSQLIHYARVCSKYEFYVQVIYSGFKVTESVILFMETSDYF